MLATAAAAAAAAAASVAFACSRHTCNRTLGPHHASHGWCQQPCLLKLALHALYLPPWRVQVRSSVLTASQCATYDEVKGRLMAATGWGNSVGIHLVTALVTGLVTTTATNWCDVIKTHMFVGE